jgi:hypothetical protein
MRLLPEKGAVAGAGAVAADQPAGRGDTLPGASAARELAAGRLAAGCWAAAGRLADEPAGPAAWHLPWASAVVQGVPQRAPLTRFVAAATMAPPC